MGNWSAYDCDNEPWNKHSRSDCIKNAFEPQMWMLPLAA